MTVSKNIHKKHVFEVIQGRARSYHPLYQTWSSMLKRCQNPKFKTFYNYGGRGIKVCRRWQTFQNFVDDMFPSYVKGLTLDRKNNNGNYQRSNCVWSNRSDQILNSRVKSVTGIKGVQITKTGFYLVNGWYDLKTYYLGCFKTLDAASKVRRKFDRALKKRDGSHVRLAVNYYG